jgi:hypothetical protein
MSDISHAPELRHGSSGEWVKYLQQLLITADTDRHRWPVSVDSSYGAGTEKAVRAFQAWVPLPVTGVVDHTTWEALYRNATTMEQVDETMGQIAGDEKAGHHGHKVEPGQEIAHQGWKCANARFVVRDFKGELHNGFGYVRFIDPHGAESDEQAQVDDGTLILSQVWMPLEGNLTLYLSAIQGGVTQLEGAISYRVGASLNLSFAVQQQSHTKQVTRNEAEGYGWVHGEKVELGVDFEVISAGGEVHSEHSGNWSIGSAEELTVRLPLPGLDITQGA